MNTYTGTKKYRKIYERYYGVKIGRDEFGRSHEIHHIDGDHDNNHPLNLMEVTIQEHYDIHYSQGDYSACLLISRAMGITSEEKSRLASLAANKRVLDGSHNFLGPENNAKRVDDGTHHLLGGEIQRESNQRRLKDGRHHFLDTEFQRDIANKRVEDGSHPFLGGEIQRESNQRRLKDGSHHLLGPNSPSQVKWTCPHCDKSGKGLGNYTRWHGDNCRHKIVCV